MINISVNNKSLTIECSELSQLLKRQDYRPPFAVAINGNFVAKEQYSQTTLSNGDVVDIVSPIFGG